jgi:type VI protein secretion system component Hcp
METVAFVYGRIIWRWEEDGIEAEDSWEASPT